MNRNLVCAAALAAAMATCAPASATIIDVDFTGTVETGSDVSGVFGPPGSDLTGDFYAVRYIFDTTVGPNYYNGPNGIIGGSYYGNVSPALSAVVTINGQSASIGLPSFSGEIANYGYYDVFSAANDSIWGGGNTTEWVTFDVFGSDINFPAGITGPFIYDDGPQFDCGSVYYPQAQCNIGEGFFYYRFRDYMTDQTIYASGTFNISTLTVSSAVPEPSTWAMLLLGFAGLGYAGYRMEKRARSAAFSSSTAT